MASTLGFGQVQFVDANNYIMIVPDAGDLTIFMIDFNQDDDDEGYITIDDLGRILFHGYGDILMSADDFISNPVIGSVYDAYGSVIGSGSFDNGKSTVAHKYSDNNGNHFDAGTGNFQIAFRKMWLYDGGWAYQYFYIDYTVNTDGSLIIHGWYVNNSYNDPITINLTSDDVGIKENIKFEEGSFKVYDLNGKILNNRDLPRGQVLIKVYENGYTKKFYLNK